MVNTDSSPDAAHGGAGWITRSRTSADELGSIWASCGQNSEYGKLLRVALHRPHDSLSKIIDAQQVHWSEPIDVRKAQRQFDQLKSTYVDRGVEVLDVFTETPTPNLMFMRDLFVMTPAGAILGRPASDVRAGEEVIVAAFLSNNKIPIIASVIGSGVFEGPDLVFVDSRTAFIGVGIRTNEDGARQVAAALKLQDIEAIMIQTTFGCGHLDGVLSIVGPKKAVLFPRRVSFKVYEVLADREYSIIPVPDIEEADNFMAINMVALGPDTVLIPENTKKTQDALKAWEIETIPVDVSELMKAGGAMHCLTGVIQRKLSP